MNGKAKEDLAVVSVLVLIVFGIVAVGLRAYHFLEEGKKSEPRPTAPVESLAGKVLDITETCPEEASVAVLRKLEPVIDPVLDAYNHKITVARLNDAQEKVGCIRDWAKSLPQGCIRTEYFFWISYYDRKIAGMREDLKEDKTVETDSAKQQREWNEKQQRILAFEDAHPIPKPPSCESDIIKRVRPDIVQKSYGDNSPNIVAPPGSTVVVK